MTIQEALQTGQKVHRLSRPDLVFQLLPDGCIEVRGEGCVLEYVPDEELFTLDDVLRTDWELVPAV